MFIISWFEPTDMYKAGKPFQSDRWHNITYVSPNLNELKHINAAVTGNFEILDTDKSACELDILLNDCVELSMPLMQHIQCTIITLGKHGIIVVRNSNSNEPFPLKHNKMKKSGKSATYYPAPPSDVISVSGAGDCLAAAMMAGIIKERRPEDCILAGLQAARMSLQVRQPVPTGLTHQTAFNSKNTDLMHWWNPRVLK